MFCLHTFMVLRWPVRGHPVPNVTVTVPTLSSPHFVFQWHSSASNIRHLLHHSQSPEVRCLHHSSDISVDHIWSPSDKWLCTVPPLSSLRFVSHWKNFPSKSRHFFITLDSKWQITSTQLQHFLHHACLPVTNDSIAVPTLSSQLLFC